MVRFGVYEADLRAGELRKQGVRLRLQDKPFRILALLLDRPGEVVTREELRSELWPADTFVDFDHNLNAAVNKLRETLGDSASNPRFIETVPRRGYRFLLPVAPAPQGLAHPAAVATGSELSQQEAAGDTGRPSAHAAGLRPWLGATVVALTVALGLAGSFYITRSRSGSVANRPPGRVTLAVLPLANPGGNPDEEYFSDGLTEEMITQLGSLNPSRLGVIARTTTMRYKGSDRGAGEIGRELGVDYILEGSVRRAGERVRITAQLVQVSDETQLWAENYERSVADVFAIQRDVAERLAQSLAMLPVLEASGPRVAETTPAAYEAYLRGRHFRELGTEEAITRGIEYFEEAVRLDPRYAPAYAGLADAYRLIGAPGWEFWPPREAMPRALVNTERALELDPYLADAHAVRGILKLNYDWDLAGADAAFRRALELNPSLARAHAWQSANLTVMARHDEAVAAARRGQELDPLSATANTTLGVRLFYAGRYAEAEAQFRKTIEITPYFVAWWGLGQCAWQLGRMTEAVEALEEAYRNSGGSSYMQAELGYMHGAAGNRDRALATLADLEALARRGYVPPFHFALVYAGLGDVDNTMAWLEKAYDDKSGWIVFLDVEPQFNLVRRDPRYVALLRKAGLRP